MPPPRYRPSLVPSFSAGSSLGSSSGGVSALPPGVGSVGKSQQSFDSWAIADHACMAGQKRLIADPSRLDEVEAWTRADSHWTRRAAMVITLPWTKQNHPKPADAAIRERVLGWAAGYVRDENWFIQKSVGWWLCDLGKHDPDRVRAFMSENGSRMKPFARREAEKNLPTL